MKCPVHANNFTHSIVHIKMQLDSGDVRWIPEPFREVIQQVDITNTVNGWKAVSILCTVLMDYCSVQSKNGVTCS